MQIKYPFDKFKVITIKKKPPQWNGKKYALEQGIQAAKNEIILLTDADCLPQNKNWIQNMMQPFMRYDTEAVVGVSFYREHPKNNLMNYFVRNETLFTTLQYTAWANIGQSYMGVGRNLAYRKKIFVAKNGFKNIASKLGGDDDLWIGKVEYIVFIKTKNASGYFVCH